MLPVIIAALGFISLSWAQTPSPAASASTSGAAPAEDKAIRPFHFSASKDALADMRRRIAATRWPDKETVNDASQGVQFATMQALGKYWATDYDWRKCEAKLNALPLIITHGWPGSIIEQMKIIGPLTDPTAYGGKAEDAFDVVIPSIPGYGFSGKPTTTGRDPTRIARAWSC